MGVLESESLLSFPSQNVFAALPKLPAVNAPLVPVITGRFAVDPIFISVRYVDVSTVPSDFNNPLVLLVST